MERGMKDEDVRSTTLQKQDKEYCAVCMHENREGNILDIDRNLEHLKSKTSLIFPSTGNSYCFGISLLLSLTIQVRDRTSSPTGVLKISDLQSQCIRYSRDTQ